jgi:MFS family permease
VSSPPDKGLGRNVVALGFVSFFTDVSSEMIYPLLPIFLTSVLGASASMLGTIEGAAESTAALLKLASGWWSDRARRRKPLVVGGYVLAGLVRPLVAAAQNTWQVLAIRLTDRVGKGIRTSPRDALIAESVDPSIRGRAFGFHSAMDNAGAVAGPLAAFVLLRWAGVSIRSVFWLSLVPSLAAMIVVIAAVKERDDSVRPPATTAPQVEAARAGMPGRFWAYLVVVLLFTLGNSTDAFLLVRATQLGVPVALAPILWAVLNLVKAALGTAGGALSDRVGRVPGLIGGWVIYALVYAGFAFASLPWHAWVLFAVYGTYFALTEGTERALVADFVPHTRRGTAFGWFYLTVGLAALPASLLFGAVWDRVGAHAAFLLGASLAASAVLGILIIPKPPRVTA